MSVALYMDVHVPADISEGLRRRGVNVLTAQEDGAGQLGDPQLLDRATSLGRVLVSQDEDLIVESVARQRSKTYFSGLAYFHQLGITIGRAIVDLELIATIYDADDIANRVEFLPL